MKKHLSTILIICMLLAGVCLLLYPTVSNYWNSLHSTQVVSNYSEAVADLDDDVYEELLEQARSYNEALAESQDGIYLDEEEMETYESLLDISGDGLMGYITIEKINVMLPIYHGTDSAVLQSGVGHLSGTSLPVGGESTHCVLSGHRGMPSALLFTNLDKLEIGDTFTLTVLDEEITYEIDQILIVEPNETESLYIVDGEDYCTLVTCTPYGINTQRLLVRGKRIENTGTHIQVSAEADTIAPMLVAAFLVIPLFLVMLMVYEVVSDVRKKGKNPTDAILPEVATGSETKNRDRLRRRTDAEKETGKRRRR
ncbi:MAG: class C sortase [Lachnospiraceae bacterium]|nr:class C sortase [Lachnospiraceae bacterium]